MIIIKKKYIEDGWEISLPSSISYHKTFTHSEFHCVIG